MHLLILGILVLLGWNIFNTGLSLGLHANTRGDMAYALIVVFTGIAVFIYGIVLILSIIF